MLKKITLTSIFIIAIFTTAAAQEMPRPAWFWRHAPKYKHLYTPPPEQRWKKMRTAGIVLASVGATVEAVALPIYIREVRERKDYQRRGVNVKDISLDEVTGSIGAYMGAAMLASGITFIIIGNSKLKKMDRVSLQMAPHTLNITYRF